MLEETIDIDQNPAVEQAEALDGSSRAVLPAESDVLGERPRTEFVDSRGVVRMSHELAAEVVVSPDIERVVDAHFGNFYDALVDIDASLEVFEEQVTDPGDFRRSIFDPFGADFLGKIKARAAEQAPQVTEQQPDTKFIMVEKKGFLGRTKTVPQEVASTKTVVKEGVTLDLPKSAEQLIEGVRYFQYEDRKDRTGEVLRTADDDKEQIGRNIVALAEELLCGDTKNYDESIRQNRQGTRLPLLAKRLAGAGVRAEDLDAEKLVELVPEIKPLLAVVEQVRDVAEAVIVRRSSRELRGALSRLAPDPELISAIYYNEDDLASIVKRYQRARSLSMIAMPKQFEQPDPSWPEPEALIDSAHQKMQNFFTGKLLADALVFHGTPFLPRIIAKGALMTPVRMKKEAVAFSYNTAANALPGKPELLDGRQAIHFAGKHGEAYTRDEAFIDQDFGSHKHLLEAEIAKGKMGAGAIAFRIGDALKQAPFIGNKYDSSDGFRSMGAHVPSVRSGVIELTEAGYEKVHDQLESMQADDDLVFLRGPRQTASDDIYDYEFPLSDALIEIGPSQPEIVLPELQAAGWTDDMIRERVIVIKRLGEKLNGGHLLSSDVAAADAELLAKALQRPTYPRSVIVGLEKVYA